MTDQEITTHIAAGDKRIADLFVRTHYASVYRLMRHLTRHREDAEDLTQQTFMTARSNIKGFRGSASLRTWLHRIAFNEYAQWKRRQRKTLPLQLDQAKDEPGFGAFIEGDFLLNALAALPDKLRETFILHEVEELSVKEVAQILNVPSGTVKARLFHARRQLRALFDEGKEVTEYEPKEATT
jgi:RNA polymerase sigma-70 factor (ECF subfamily)